MKAQRPENYETRMELKEMPDGTWEVREIHIYKYDKPLAARNKLEKYMYEKMNKDN
jgi:hypothetical protein